MEDVANRIVTRLYNELITASSSARACVLVRTLITLPYGQLTEEQQTFEKRYHQIPTAFGAARRTAWQCRSSSASCSSYDGIEPTTARLRSVLD